ncbi:MAG: prepilin-type N-terminal cleavage/methylation domain-containing protein [Planctomycetota bacterium]
MLRRLDRAPQVIGRNAGFTLLELVIVVVVLGVLAGVAVPRITHAGANARVNAAAKEFRQFEMALRLYHAHHGAFPPNQLSGVYPPELEGYYDEAYFNRAPPFGYEWDWNPAHGPYPHIAMVGDLNQDLVQRFDERFDDGDTGSGSIQRWDAEHLAWRIAP